MHRWKVTLVDAGGTVTARGFTRAGTRRKAVRLRRALGITGHTSMQVTRL